MILTLYFGSYQLYFHQKGTTYYEKPGYYFCLPKGDKPRKFLKTWRPITLLNVFFYKLISGCLSQRLKSTLIFLISETQSGFMKGRYIGENTRFI